MNIIKEQRETIILENNTAQQKLSDILEDFNKRANTIDIREPLHGDVDLSILRELGFLHVKNILFVEGEITNIINIPEGILQLVCPKNLLFSLDDLPSSLVHLEIPYNYLTQLDFSKIKELKYLNISHNSFTTLENLGSKIEEIYCNNNHLEYVNLNLLNDLKILHVSNNQILEMENLPSTIVDFQYENNPNITIQYRQESVQNAADGDDGDDEKRVKQNVNYMEALDKYFKLKTNYEKKLYEKKKKVYELESNRKKRRKLLNEVKADCINCRRPVGTIFSSKQNRYTAICGDAQKPCNLNIEIFNGDFITSNIVDLVSTFTNDILSIKKNEIISDKLDTLFSYVSEKDSIDKFKKDLEEYNNYSNKTKTLLDIYNEMHNNPYQMDLIQKKKDKIFLLSENNRRLLNEYQTTGNRELLKSALQLQVNDLLPETRNLRLLMYKHMEMNTNEKSQGVMIHSLFQKNIELSKMVEYGHGEPPRVIKFSTTKSL